MQDNWQNKPSPKFGVLRPLGDFKGKIRNSEILYEDLWKHDEYIHNIVDPETIEIPSKPIKPQFNIFGSSVKNQKDFERYRRLVDEYNNAIESKTKALNLIRLHQKIKNDANYCCFFCGFKDERFLEIHHLDSNHFNNEESNLKAACTLCHRQHHLLWLSVNDQAELGAANINFLPQVELNHLQRISIVMASDPEYNGLLGIQGRLGVNLALLKNQFSRPLSAFLVPDEKKAESWREFVATNNLSNPVNSKVANYLVIETALENMDRPNQDKQVKDAIDTYDYFIGLADAKKLDPNATEEDIRNKNRIIVRELMVKYVKAYEVKFEDNFLNNRETFSIFELAMALGSVDYKDYQKFNPKYLFLLFKSSIFTHEQIEYYKTLDYFNVENWGFGNH